MIFMMFLFETILKLFFKHSPRKAMNKSYANAAMKVRKLMNIMVLHSNYRSYETLFF